MDKKIDMDIRPPMGSMMTPRMGNMTEDIFFNRLSRSGAVCSCGIPYVELKDDKISEDDIVRINEFAFNIEKNNKGIYIPAVFVHPCFPDVSCNMMKVGKNKGLRVAGFLSQNNMQDPGFRKIAEKAIECDMTILLKADNSKAVSEMASLYPQLRLLVLFECVVGVTPQEISALLKKHENVYVCLSMVMLTWNYILHSLLETCRADRFVYGSGYPFVEPSCRAASICWELRDQPEAVRSAILYGNAAKLLGIKEE